MNVKLHIERLILEGITLAPHEHRPLQASVEAELGRLLSAGGVSQELAGGIALPSLRAGDIQLGAGGGRCRLGGRLRRRCMEGSGNELSTRFIFQEIRRTYDVDTIEAFQHQ